VFYFSLYLDERAMEMTLVPALIVFVALNGQMQQQIVVEVERKVCGITTYGAIQDPVIGRIEGVLSIKCLSSK
jgi:hypothetical protein